MQDIDRSLITRLIKKLKDIEKKELINNHIVLMPDFFIDHFLTIENFEDSIIKIKYLYQQGGGNLPGVKQKISQGGNAANTALALSKLGFSSHLICRTDKLGFHFLEYFLGKNGVDISYVKSDGKISITTALEFGEKQKNVMIGETGSTSDFSFESLEEKDKDLILGSDMLCVTNWTLNKRGTDLATNAFKLAKQNSIKTFLDTGDPSHRKNEIQNLMNNVLSNKNLDILGLNENELFHYSNYKTNSVEDIINAAIKLKNKIHARIDLHTADFTCTIDKDSILVPVLHIHKKYRSTGAGDAWNAGDIFGEILGFQDDERLLFASSLAAYYISSEDPIHPSLDEIIRFIGKI